MAACTLDPLSDQRWGPFVDGHHRSSIFHTPEWLSAIRKTYGYAPIVYTTNRPDEPLTNGIVICQVRSWLTGKRLVGVPFADHCDMLSDDISERESLLASLQAAVRNEGWSYVEIRPRDPEAMARIQTFSKCNSYQLHAIDLGPSKEELFARLHKDSNQRKIRKAEREGLTYEEGRSEEFLENFYRLHVLTRRRHKLPPQPIQWFRNLMNAMGDRLTICTASKDGRALGSIVTLRHGRTLVYKYGASDASTHNLGTMPLIFWRVICGAKDAGIAEIDLGRSSPDDEGLITFKDRLGGARSIVSYFAFSRRGVASTTNSSLMKYAQPVFAKMPDRLFIASGQLLYRHIG